MEGSRTIRLDLEYDGADFVGWQIQSQGRSVQGELARCLSTFLQEEVVPVAAGRTDAGTHALGQVAHFRTDSDHHPDRMVRALNSLLPEDVAVTAAREVDAEFHARYSAISKRYRYRIDTRKAPLERGFVWNLYRDLDFSAMEEASRALLGGVHSFRAFCNSDPVPDSYDCDVLDACLKRDCTEISFEIEANRFLRHMVRIIVGTLVDVGEGRLSAADFVTLLGDGSSDRSDAGQTAPAHGLCLLWVRYPGD